MVQDKDKKRLGKEVEARPKQRSQGRVFYPTSNGESQRGSKAFGDMTSLGDDLQGLERGLEG